jgi:TPR repeat protein
MGRFFYDAVEESIRSIYAGIIVQDFARGFSLLREAVKAGDADAKYLLSRCYLGKDFTYWDSTGFPENEGEAFRLMEESAWEGSAIGALGAFRLGRLPPFEGDETPFPAAKEAFAAVLDIAERGEPFSQFLIGAAYSWGDVYEMEGLGNCGEAPREWREPCVFWYKKALDGGLHWCANNLVYLYQTGKCGHSVDICPPSPQEERALVEQLAAMGNPRFESVLGIMLLDEGRREDALRFLLSAAQKGDILSAFWVGDIFDQGYGGEVDMAFANRCYESAAARGHAKAQSYLAHHLYFGLGAEIDYGRAFFWAEQSVRRQEELGYFIMGLCFFHGRGTSKNYESARVFLEKSAQPYRDSALCALGDIYAQGLGVPADIEKGCSYYLELKKRNAAAGYSRLAQYKKSPFGGWKRR